MSQHGHISGEFEKTKIAKYSLFSLLIGCVFFEIISLLEWIFYPRFPDPGLLFARADFVVFRLLAPLSVLPLVIILYFSLGKMVFLHDSHLKHRFLSPFGILLRILSDYRRLVLVTSEKARLVIVSRPRILLLVTIAMSILVVA